MQPYIETKQISGFVQKGLVRRLKDAQIGIVDIAFSNGIKLMKILVQQRIRKRDLQIWIVGLKIKNRNSIRLLGLIQCSRSATPSSPAGTGKILRNLSLNFNPSWKKDEDQQQSS